MNIVNKKELQLLEDEVHELYHIYIAAYHNAINAHVANAIPVEPEGDTFSVVGHVAKTLAVRGAKNDWAILTKSQFYDRARELLED